MSQPSDINQAIIDGATGPKSVRVGNETVEAQSVDEQMKAASFIAGQTAATKPHFGLRMTKMIPGSSGG